MSIQAAKRAFCKWGRGSDRIEQELHRTVGGTANPILRVLNLRVRVRWRCWRTVAVSVSNALPGFHAKSREKVTV